MSLDIGAVADLGGSEPVDLCFYWNYTHNVNPMWRDLFGVTLGELLTRFPNAGESLPILRMGLRRFASEPEHFERMNPENGWGSHDTAVVALRRLVEFASTRPAATWVVSQ